jgi:hypothetical protein
MFARCFWLTLLGFFVCLGPARGQIAASLQVTRKMHVAGEPVLAVVTITNHAGRTLIFQSDGRFQWLNFMVRDASGNMVNPRLNKMFGPMKIDAGQTLAREVDLTQYFQLTEPGNFAVVASIREPGESETMSHTNKVFFNQNNGRTYWSQKIGLGGGSSATREYRLIHFTDESKSYLYAQIRDAPSGRALRTFRLGEVLMLRRPQVTVDRSQRMNVMYLGTATMWVHCVVDKDGNLLGSQIHQRGPVGDPRLVAAGNGTVQVVNSIPYDRKAAEEAKKKIRKATDRPDITY